jgi:acetylornithine deacetylase
MTEIEKLLKDLILIPSPSGSEKVIGEFIFNLLEKQGFEVNKCPVSKDRFNVVAKLGEPKVYLAAHMDTVNPILDYRETKSHIYGRGSCDTKASVAGMITAAITAKNEGYHNFGLIFTVGEEFNLDGAKAIVKSKLNIPFVIVGEPTSLAIVNGHFGILIIKVTAKGKTAHSSRPEMGINAIDMLLEVISKVKKMPIGSETLMSLVQINGGFADNIIPDKAEAMFSFRISPDDLTDYAEKIKLLSTNDVEVEIVQQIGAVYCKVPTQLSFIKTVKTVKYLTELSFYKNGVVLGPGDIQYAHGPEENLDRKELPQAVEIYKEILRNFT